ncbi:hypothetical protein C8R45DRAFT_1043910 [Mycena sanguinolenta]|nr:hypothetical protein C8R45DRAFT_1043910 [Mycena sanguinolenta]
MDSAQQEIYAGRSSVMPVSDSTTRGAIPYLHILPIELWLACWAQCSRGQLRRLTLVCKLFRGICLPLLFQHQTIEAREEWFNKSNWVERLHSLHRAAVRLDSLRESAHVGSIRSWHFAAGKFRLPFTVETFIPHIGLITPTHARLVETFSATLCLYRNLRSLYLEALIIEASFRKTFRELSRLEDLALCDCDIVARDGLVMSLHSFTISTKKPAVYAVKVPQEPLRIVSPDFLHSLHLDAPGETASLLTAFGRAQFPHLVVLSFQHLSNLEMFLAFLTQCPALEVLKITTVHRDVIASLPRYTLSPDTIPVLYDITVRDEMVGFFSLNRPITTVTILKEPSHRPSVGYLTPAVLNGLSTTSVPLLSLCIDQASPTLELLTSITSLFPHLQQLSVHLPQPSVGRIYKCGRGRPPRPPSVDDRCPALRDADAFNDIPEDFLSDVEEEQGEPASIAQVRVPQELEMSSLTNLHVVLDWICSGAASLPQEIEFLRLIWNERWKPDFLPPNEPFSPPGFSPTREHGVVATLSHRYPHLRELEMGYLMLWTRKGAVWRKSGTDSCLQVVL